MKNLHHITSYYIISYNIICKSYLFIYQPYNKILFPSLLLKKCVITCPHKQVEIPASFKKSHHTAVLQVSLCISCQLKLKFSVTLPSGFSSSENVFHCRYLPSCVIFRVKSFRVLNYESKFQIFCLEREKNSESLKWQQWCVESMLMIKTRQRSFAVVLSLKLQQCSSSLKNVIH